jgi:hypothetical protein
MRESTGRRWALVPGLLMLLHGASSGNIAKEDLERRLDRLRSLPYTATTTERTAPGESGVVIYDSGRTWPGHNLYCCGPCPDVRLMDMEGTVIHAWGHPDGDKGRWHHAVMLPDGSTAGISNEPRYLIRLDRNSDLVWKRDIPCHHEILLSSDSTLLTIMDEKVSYRDLEVLFPVIVELTLGGEEIGRWSACEHLEEMKTVFDTSSFLDTILDSMLAEGRNLRRIGTRNEATPLPEGGVLYDYFHMNAIDVLPETPLSPLARAFQPGNLLICLKHVNQIGILDRVTGEPLWAWGEGVMEWPHHPTMLDNGNILVFDNGSHRGYSRILEINPLTKAIEWEYVENPREDFFSYSRGSAQRLPNGNTLICESDRGRAFEVTEEGETVWEWFNPMISEGKRGQVYRMIRVPPDAVGVLSVPEQVR